jgi:hypothetical protein
MNDGIICVALIRIDERRLYKARAGSGAVAEPVVEAGESFLETAIIPTLSGFRDDPFRPNSANHRVVRMPLGDDPRDHTCRYHGSQIKTSANNEITE